MDDGRLQNSLVFLAAEVGIWLVAWKMKEAVPWRRSSSSVWRDGSVRESNSWYAWITSSDQIILCLVEDILGAEIFPVEGEGDLGEEDIMTGVDKCT